jgi:crotonobetainyl-CoA:carnitine CoA-transferase CaiB-like acyl-CoA transferase
MAGENQLCIGLPFTPITKPHELYDDPDLEASKGVLNLNLTLPTSGKAGVPSLPLRMGGRKLGVRLDLPGVNKHGLKLLRELGVSKLGIERLISSGVLKINETHS